MPLAGLWKYEAARRLVLPLFGAGFVVNWCAAVDPFTAFWGATASHLVEKNFPLAFAGALVGSGFYYAVVRCFDPAPARCSDGADPRSVPPPDHVTRLT